MTQLAIRILLALVLASTLGLRAGAEEPSVVASATLSEENGAARLDLAIVGSARPTVVLMRDPYRVVLDFDGTLSAASMPAPERNGLLTAIRDGLAGRDRYRVILTLRKPAKPIVQTVPSETGATVRLGLEPGSDADFALAPDPQGPDNRSADVPATPRRPFVIVLDPGHGGIDKGATGEGGTEEKTVNLAFALELREALRKIGGIEVVMTRTDDTFIPLAERSAVARRANADLFLSLHADSIRYRDLRGATVYTLSDTASDQLSREIAEGENASDRFAGPEWDGDVPEIHDILVDLVRRETESYSDGFATQLVLELKRGEIRLINNPRRSAGFRVLRAPDVPSILLEMGYISNREEEQLLLSVDWQRRLAAIVAGAVGDFAREKTGAAL